MKAYVITMSDHTESALMTTHLIDSIDSTGTNLKVEIHEATQPNTLGKDISETFGRHVPWTWPTDSSQDCVDLHTGLYKRKYESTDQQRVQACAISHFALWKKCFEDNVPYVILEHDAFFLKKFDPTKYIHKKWGVIGLNNPLGNTRKASAFDAHVKAQGKGIHDAPNVDGSREIPLPQGLAGNSAYMIKPHAAKKLLDKIDEIGMWPNDAIMCKQLFPGLLKVVYPYYTDTQKNVSTTTKL